MTTDSGQPQIADTGRFEAAIRRFDAANSLDPNLEIGEGIARPRELIYAERLTHWVRKLCPDASEELCLAARCQHICRWMVARGSYPMTRHGYLKWREDLKQFHAEKAGEILRAVGYPEETVAKVQTLNLKRNFPQDPDSRVLEDALCLVFLEFQFAELAAKTTNDKMVNALQKSWKKMTPAAREHAMKLSFGPQEKSLLERAFSETPHQDFQRMGTVDIRRSTLASPDAARLIAALNAELKATFPEPGATHFSLAGAQVAAGDGAFLIAYLEDVAVGCGAVRRLDETTAELKRMYVDPSVRGRGIGRALVGALEREARLRGMRRVVLETGTRLAPAIKLYEAMGYARIPLLGEYLSSPDTSLCFGKSLA